MRIFFLTLFTTTIVTPTIIVMIDDSIDVSMFYNITEEEEKKEMENDGKKELIFSNYINPDCLFKTSLTTLAHSYSFKNYASPYLNIIFPPPETQLF